MRWRVRASPRPHQRIVERQQSAESPAFAPDFSPCSKALGWPHVRWAYQRQSSSRACRRNPRRRHMARTDARPTAAAGGDRATRATSAPRIRRDLSLRKGSALEPQRLPRRRFPLSTPFGVAGRDENAPSPAPFETSCQSWPAIDRLTTAETGGERIRRSGGRESRRRSARAHNGRRRTPVRRRRLDRRPAQARSPRWAQPPRARSSETVGQDDLRQYRRHRADHHHQHHRAARRHSPAPTESAHRAQTPPAASSRSGSAGLLQTTR